MARRDNLTHWLISTQAETPEGHDQDARDITERRATNITKAGLDDHGPEEFAREGETAVRQALGQKAKKRKGNKKPPETHRCDKQGAGEGEIGKKEAPDRAREAAVSRTGAKLEELPTVANPTKKVLARVDRRACLLYTSPSPRDQRGSRMPSSA